MQQFILHRARNEHLVKKTFEEVGAANQHQIMQRAGIGHNDACHLFADAPQVLQVRR